MDWHWILKRFFRKISAWEHMALSLAGRFILSQSVLTQLAVYWAHIFSLPASIILKINRLLANFIWSGSSNPFKIHLAKLEMISLPKKYGGWGLLDMQSFGRALLCKSLTRALFRDGLWSSAIRKKYMQDKDLIYWYWRGSIGISHGSAIWLSLRKVQQYFIRRLRWNLFSGEHVFIGIDPIIDDRELACFSNNLISFLHRQGLFTWDKIISSWCGPIPIWSNAYELHLLVSLHAEWNSVLSFLCSLSIHRAGHEDSLIWFVPNKKLPIRVCDIYTDLILTKADNSGSIFSNRFWKLEAFQWWCAQKESWHSMFIIVLWCLWKWRNAKIFQESKEPLRSTLHHIIVTYGVFPDRVPKKDNQKNTDGSVPHFSFLATFFDGAE
eukprot:PITA_25540